MSIFSKVIFFLLFFIGAVVFPTRLSLEAKGLPPVKEEVGQKQKLESTYRLIEGTRQKNMGNWAQAVVEYLEATKLDPNNDAAYFELGRAHLVMGEYSDAISFAEKALQLDPQNVHYHILLADLFLFTDDVEGATSVFEELVKKYPERADFKIRLANNYVFTKDFDAALGVLTQLENEGGHSDLVAFKRLNILVQMDRKQEAISEAEKMLQLFSDDLFLIETLGGLYLEKGEAEKAKVLFEDFLEQDPNNPDAILLLSDFHQDQGNLFVAVELLEKAFENPMLENIEKERILYVLYFISDENPEVLPKAAELAGHFVEQNPEYAQGHNIYADLQNQLGNYSEARDSYLVSTELDPSNLVAWQQLLYLDNRLEDYVAMLEHSNLATEYFFEQPLLFMLNAHANMMLEKYDDALASLQYGLLILQDDPRLRIEFHVLLGDVNHYLGNHSESDQNYEKALELDADNAGALNNFAYMLSLRKERLDEALEMAEKANELQPNTTAFEDTLGWVYFQLGEYEKARYWIEKALRSTEAPSATIIEHYGDVLFKLGNADKAVEYWQSAKEAGGASVVLERKIAEKEYHE